MDAKKLIKQRDRNRVLKAISYIAGFPLLIAVVFIGSIPFMGESAFSDTWYYGAVVCVAAWLVVTVFQILVSVITKNYSARAVFVVIVTLIIMVGGTVYFDIWAEKKVQDARISYVNDLYNVGENDKIEFVGMNNVVITYDKDVKATADGATVPTYKYSIALKNYKNQVASYVPWTKKTGTVDDFNGNVDEFQRVYNVGYGSSVKGSVNTDGSEYGKTTIEKEDGTLEYWFGEEGAVYKENGLYADGYIFSMAVANEILITYYETQNKYAALNKDADVELEAALEKARNSTAWKNYVKTDEYKAAYGVGGTADRYTITLGRLDKIISALGHGLYEEGVYKLLTNPIVKNIIDISEYGITESVIKNLSLENVIDIAGGLGLTISEDDIMALLGGFSNYEVSNVRPLMYFIEDETLRTYAYARYFGETHGANIGSVLIPSKKVETVDGKTQVTYGNVGHITMSTSGAPQSDAYTLQECYLLRAEMSYMPKLFPLFAARRYAYIFAGIIALCYVIFYYAKLKVYLKGKKLEKNCIKGGVR